MDSCNRDQAPAVHQARLKLQGTRRGRGRCAAQGRTVSRGNKQSVCDPQGLREATGDEQNRREPMWGDEAVLAAQRPRLFGL